MASRARIIVEPLGDQELALADVGDCLRKRLVGLIGRHSLLPGEGLLLNGCGLVHTCFMRFSIDILFLDRRGYVLRRVDRLPPFRGAWGGWRARVTIELPAGALQPAGVQRGDHIRVEAI